MLEAAADVRAGGGIGCTTGGWARWTVGRRGGGMSAGLVREAGREATSGVPLRMGARRARMGDTVGAAVSRQRISARP